MNAETVQSALRIKRKQPPLTYMPSVNQTFDDDICKGTLLK